MRFFVISACLVRLYAAFASFSERVHPNMLTIARLMFRVMGCFMQSHGLLWRKAAHTAA